MPSGRVCLGRIIGVHGVRGHLKIRAYTDDPAALDQYGPVSLEDGRTLTLRVKTVTPKGPVIVSAKEITDRNIAEQMRGLDMYIDRSALPPVTDEEIYQADLVGLNAVTEAGKVIGQIIGIHDFGAGEIAEIKPADGASVMLPFAPPFRGDVKVDEGLVILCPPDGMLDLVLADDASAGRVSAGTRAGTDTVTDTGKDTGKDAGKGKKR